MDDKKHEQQLSDNFDRIFAQLVIFAQGKGLVSTGFGGDTRYEDPEDFAQSCLIEYARYAGDQSYREMKVGTLWRIAQNRAKDAYRRNGSRPRVQLLTKEIPAKRISNLPAVRTLLCGLSFEDGILGLLSRDASDIMRLKYVAGYTNQAVAETMGLSIEGVRSSLKRSKAKLRKSL